MADNVVHIALDADVKKQQERLFIRLFQILNREIEHAKGNQLFLGELGARESSKKA
jgi:hypothetical protein